MKKLFALTSVLLAVHVINAQSVKYNQSLADSLGADANGMKAYVFVILKKGSATIEDKQLRDSLFAGHLKNIGRLADEHKLVVAGPMFANDKNYQGIFIFNVKTIDEAKKLLETDPAVKANLLDTEMYRWYSSAALPMYLKYHYEIEKKSLN